MIMYATMKFEEEMVPTTLIKEIFINADENSLLRNNWARAYYPGDNHTWCVEIEEWDIVIAETFHQENEGVYVPSRSRGP